MKRNSISLGFILLLVSVQSSRFDITSNAKCVRQENGHCVQWNQVGQVVQQIGACFPQDTYILSQERGFIQMKDLKVGYHILSHPGNCQEIDCSNHFTEVRGWLHRITQTSFDQYLHIVSDTEGFYVSPQHNIGAFDYSEQQPHYYFAQEVKGMRLFNYGDQGQQVTDISIVQKKGLYAPLTETNNYYIFRVSHLGSPTINSKVLAHCYAQIRNPTMYEPIVDSFFAAYENVFTKPSEDLPVHPVAKWLAQNFRFLLEGVQKQ